MRKVIFMISITIAMVFQFLILGGCSQQWREAHSEVDDKELFNILGQVGDNSSDAGVTRFLELAREDKSSIVYFAGAPGSMGAVESVLAFDDLGVIDTRLSGLRTFDVNPKSVTVFFVDSVEAGPNREFGLMVEIKGAANFDTISKVFLSNGGGFSFDDDEFTVELSSSAGEKLFLSSYDVIAGSDELKSIIQLKVIEVLSDGTEIIVGKFSTMIGYYGQN